jgi:hypothetical protein
MIPEKLFKDTEVELNDVDELTDILNNYLNKSCAFFYYVHGMTPITKDLIHAFYKLRIRILEIAVRRYEELKESNDYTLYNTDYVIRQAQCQAEIDEAKSDYEFFIDTGKIKDN